MLFSGKLDPHPPPRNANNVEPYTFVTRFSGKVDTTHPHLHYVTLEWPLRGKTNKSGAIVDTPHPHLHYVTLEWPLRGKTRVVQSSKKIKEKRLKWYDHVRRMKEEHIVRRMLDVDIPGKRRRGRPNLRWKDACKRDIRQTRGWKRTRQQTAWRKKINSYTSDPRQASDEEEEVINILTHHSIMKTNDTFNSKLYIHHLIISLTLPWTCARL